MNFRAGEGASENYGLIPVKKNTAFDVPADGAGKDDLFKIAAFADEIFDGVAVRYADHVLLDDGTVIEYFSDIVAGRADQFDATLEGLVVWPGTNECGQK